MTPTVLKAADAAQFLSFVPRMLGYQPTRSLVVIPFRGVRSLGAMRFDLPIEPGADVDRMAATVIGMACRLPEADAVAAIAYTDGQFDEEGGMPHRDLLGALGQRADACGLHVTDLLCVAADGWGSALDADCPSDGRPLDGLPSAIDAGDLPEPAGDQATGTELPGFTAEERERVAKALQALDDAVRVLCGPDGDSSRTAGSARRTGRGGVACTSPIAIEAPAPARDLGPVPPPLGGGGGEEVPDDSEPARIDPRALATVCRLDDLPRFYEEALGVSPASFDAYETAAVVWCLARPSLRDVALVQWSGNVSQGDEALDAQLRWEDGEEYPAHLAMRMWGEGEQPQPSRLRAALEVARHAAAAAPRELQPGSLAMCAWLSWALGGSTHAAAYAGRACEIEPEHGLSQIVLSFVHAAHLPDWAFRRRAGVR